MFTLSQFRAPVTYNTAITSVMHDIVCEGLVFWIYFLSGTVDGSLYSLPDLQLPPSEVEINVLSWQSCLKLKDFIHKHFQLSNTKRYKKVHLTELAKTLQPILFDSVPDEDAENIEFLKAS